MLREPEVIADTQPQQTQRSSHRQGQPLTADHIVTLLPQQLYSLRVLKTKHSAFLPVLSLLVLLLTKENLKLICYHLGKDSSIIDFGQNFENYLIDR